jgi:hypothetical protein
MRAMPVRTKIAWAAVRWVTWCAHVIHVGMSALTSRTATHVQGAQGRVMNRRRVPARTHNRS